MAVNNLFHNGKTDASAFGFTAVRTIETFKQMRQFLCIHTAAIIRYRTKKRCVALIQMNDDLTDIRRVFTSVLQEIHVRFAQPLFVAANGSVALDFQYFRGINRSKPLPGIMDKSCKCAELWVFGSRVTPGMEREIVKAEERGMPIRYFDEDMEEHTNG